MSAPQDVCRCLSPEQWRDGLCGYCGRPQRSLYAPHEPEVALTAHAQIVAREHARQNALAHHLQGVAEAVAGMRGQVTLSAEVLLQVAGLSVSEDARSRTVRFSVTVPRVPQPPLEPPVYVS